MNTVLSNIGPEVLGTVVGFAVIIDPGKRRIKIDLTDARQVGILLELDTSKVGGIELYTRFLGPEGEELSLAFPSINYVQNAINKGGYREMCIGGCGKIAWFLGRRNTDYSYGGWRCSECLE